MTNHDKPLTPYVSFNRWFLIPFILWVLFGGLALLVYDQQVLFSIVNTNHTRWLDTAMHWITRMGEGVFGGIILLILLSREAFRNWWYFSAAVLCNLVPALLTQYVKSLVNAPRPLNVFRDADWVHHIPEWERLFERSFPSGHTCAGFSLFCFLSLILLPKDKWWGLIFFILAMLVGYSRIYLAAHFFLDVYVGSIIGVFFNILVLMIMRKYTQYFYKRRKSQSV